MKLKLFLISLGLVLITLLAYWPVLNCAFINFDDPMYILTNQHVTTGLTLDNIQWAFTSFYASNWHPLTWLSHMVDVQLFDLEASMHHAVNLLWHMANVLLLFIVFRTFTGSLWRSALVSALFAIHPLHVETVAWVSERKDLLSTFFGLLAIYSYWFVAQSRRKSFQLLLILNFTLSLLGKPMWVSLPFILLLLDYWPLNRFIKKPKAIFQLIIEKLPLFAIAAASCLITFIAQNAGGAVTSLEKTSLALRFANALVAYVSYLYKFIIPLKLGIFYPLPATIPIWKTVGALLVLLAITGVVWRYRSKFPCLLMGWLWYLVTLVPVIGIVQVGSQALADRYTYLPSIGVFVMFVFGVISSTRFGISTEGRDLKISRDARNDNKSKISKLPWLWGTAITLALISLSTLTYLQCQYWQNSISLFEHNLKVTKNNAVAHINLGSVYGKEQNFENALKHLNSALAIKPNDPLALYNLGLIHHNQGQLPLAIANYKLAMQYQPNYPEALNNLGNCYQALGDLISAINYYETAISLRPNYPEAYNNLGTAYAVKGEMNKAIEQFHLALKYRPNYPSAWKNLRKAKSFSINHNRNLGAIC